MSLVYRIPILTASYSAQAPVSLNSRRPLSRPVAAHGIVSVIKMSSLHEKDVHGEVNLSLSPTFSPYKLCFLHLIVL